ncbi:MAG: type II TA system antitoxin MqsA family protein [Isosphaeraceae bacterium]
MNVKPFPWKCGRCRERAVHPAILDTYTADLDHGGRIHSVSLSDFQVQKCQNCGAIVLDDEANRRLSDALRSAAGLLYPAEVRSQRESLKLSRKELARYLQIAEATLSRWETGAQIQQRSMDKLLRGFFGVEEFRRFLGVPDPAPAMPSQRSDAESVATPKGTQKETMWIPASVLGSRP